MKTIVAVLDQYREAEGLAYDLMARGFKRENIEVGRTVKGEALKRKGGKRPLDRPLPSAEKRGEGVRGYYPGGPHGQEAFVAISVSEEDAPLAQEIMRSHRVLFVEERSEPLSQF